MKLPKKLAAQLDAYYATLAEFDHQYVLHEGATSIAFQALLADVARGHHWTLIPQLTAKGIRPDATLKDPMGLVRGHWEAKDTHDDLDAEIAKKTKKGYPLANIIFEDTRTAVLIQDKRPVMRVDLKQREQLADLLQAFFAYVEPQVESFEQAVDEFKQRVPDLAKHLKDKIGDAHAGTDGPPRVGPNKKFNDAFAAFMDVCRSSLDLNITAAAVDDMLVQHLLTERLIRTVFDNPEFTHRNVIAAEIEKVIDALTSKSFDRRAYLKALDRFYVAIENAAATITEWADKQHFLNTVYERFFQGYSVKLADTMGIVYTPQPIVDFMCASVVEVLQTEFGKTLGDPDVNILDPCTGTGNFIVNLLRRVPKKDLPRVYREQLFANEIMLLPYYIAALNIEHAYWEQTGDYEPFEGLCFVDTLDLAESRQAEMAFMTAKNTERVERQRKTPITVIVGNPPYNAWQENENDNNKNRKYSGLEQRIRETYSRASKASNRSALSDVYVKFFRWASDRLAEHDGVICYVSNNSFVDQLAFDGMRKYLASEFTAVYHLHLEGNVRHDPEKSGTAYNVFGIQVGVGITIAIRSQASASTGVHFARIDKKLRRTEKLAWLSKTNGVGQIEWQQLKPDDRHSWIIPQNAAAFRTFMPIGSKSDRDPDAARGIFGMYTVGLKTNRDDVLYDFDLDVLKLRVARFVDQYNGEVDRYKRSMRPLQIDSFVDYSKLKWSEGLKMSLAREKHATYSDDNVRSCLYRPFTKKGLYHDPILIERTYRYGVVVPNATAARENTTLITTDVAAEKPFMAMAATGFTDLHAVGAGASSQCFPFYVYDADGTNRRENITDWSLGQFRSHYGDQTIGKWDVFHYVYGLLHHGGYRAKFADNLKRELPRVPFAADFRAFAGAGAALAGLHLGYESAEPWPLTWVYTPGVPLSYRVERMRLSKDKATVTVNPSLALADVPGEVGRYRLGNRSALEWVVDQYQVGTDKRSGIVSDPNRADDEEYIVRLVGQVVRVSVETVRIVEELPAAFAPAEGGVGDG